MNTARRLRLTLLLALLTLGSFFLLMRPSAPARAEEPDGAYLTRVEQRLAEADAAATDAPTAALPMTPCVGGMAGVYPCNNVDLMAFVPRDAMDNNPATTVSVSSLWGWTDTGSGREFALVGMRNGTSFVEITDAANPVVVGFLPTHTGTTSWRELKVYQHYAYIVSDSNGAHGVQVFDLNRLLTATPPTTFTEDGHYGGTGATATAGSIHNIVINQQSGFAYAVGTSSGTNRCSGGLHMISLADPLVPVFVNCYGLDGYVHDADCLTYNGPDATYTGHEICVNSNGSDGAISVVDVTDKMNPVRIANVPYTGGEYTHQTFFTPDLAYMVLDDELDESNNGHPSRTYIWDMRDLDNPIQFATYTAAFPAIDHNQYIKGNYDYQATYTAGMRILDISNIATGTLTEVAFFDTFPANNNASFSSAWNVFPYFNSGNVIVSSIGEGLFILRPNLAPTAVTVSDLGGASAPAWPLAVAAAGLVALAGAAGLVRRRR